MAHLVFSWQSADYLSNLLPENALFLADRAFCAHRCAETAFSLALAFFHCAQYSQAYHVLAPFFDVRSEAVRDEPHRQPLPSDSVRYLMVVILVRLEKWKAAEQLLTQSGGVPNGVFGLFHLGEVYFRTGRTRDAVTCYKECVRQNPFFFVAWQRLCDLGEKTCAFPEETTVFSMHSQAIALHNFQWGEGSANSSSSSTWTDAAHPGSVAPAGAGHSSPAAGLPLLADSGLSGTVSSRDGVSAVASPSALSAAVPSAPKPLKRAAGGQAHAAQSRGTTSSADSDHANGNGNSSNVLSPRTWRPIRTSVGAPQPLLFAGSPGLARQACLVSRGGMFSPASSSNSKLRYLATPSEGRFGPRDLSTRDLRDAYRVVYACAQVVHALSFFELDRVLRLLEPSTRECSAAVARHQTARLEQLHRSRKRPLPSRDSRSSSVEAGMSIGDREVVLDEISGFSATMLAKANFEMGNYQSALAFFQAAREYDPWRIQGCDHFSTLLWHLRREPSLAQLVTSLRDISPEHPVTFVVLGNLLSLRKCGQQALRCFQRAAHADPMYAYARTLEGHEHMHREEFELAEASFRAALSVCPRHYNAWYGLGQINFRLEQHLEAFQHFSKAVSTNPVSPVLRCYLGMSQVAVGSLQEALDTFSWCCDRNSSQPVARFHRAQTLEALNRVSDAISDMEHVRGMAPKEHAVLVYLAKLYERERQFSKALELLQSAIELEGASRKEINAQIESLQDKLKNPSALA